jgi:hypothetical protein
MLSLGLLLHIISFLSRDENQSKTVLYFKNAGQERAKSPNFYFYEFHSIPSIP